MKIQTLILVLFIGLLPTFAQGQCEKCKIENVLEVSKHIDSLTFQIVFDFLCTVDSTCNTNAEFTEFSNEMLFKVLDKTPTLFFKAITSGKVNNKAILSDLNSPLTDINIQGIYDKVKIANISIDLKTEFLNALIMAANESNQLLRK